MDVYGMLHEQLTKLSEEGIDKSLSVQMSGLLASLVIPSDKLASARMCGIYLRQVAGALLDPSPSLSEVIKNGIAEGECRDTPAELAAAVREEMPPAELATEQTGNLALLIGIMAYVSIAVRGGGEFGRLFACSWLEYFATGRN